MMTFSIATEADIPALSELLSILFEQELEFKPDERAQLRGLSMIIKAPDCGVILVARDGDRIVAMVNLLYSVSTALGERVAMLEDMVVAPSARGSGVGSALLREAITYARGCDVKRITLLTDRANESAQRFYAGHGFVQSTMIPLRLHLP